LRCKSKPQVAQLRQGVDILVARSINRFAKQGLLTLSKVEILVLDEADRMLDMGFLRDIERILKVLPAKKLNVFSDFSKDIKKHKPVQVEETPENTTVDAI
jgi:ATP-dependent RNA helicase RhlE